MFSHEGKKKQVKKKKLKGYSSGSLGDIANIGSRVYPMDLKMNFTLTHLYRGHEMEYNCQHSMLFAFRENRSIVAVIFLQAS